MQFIQIDGGEAKFNDTQESADFGTLPATGSDSVLYVTLDDNKLYRWTGSIYIEVSPSTGGSLTDGEIKIAYESNADTNAFTDAEQAEIQAIREMMTDSNEASGFIREQVATMGILEFSPNGTDVYKIDQNSNFTKNTSGNFANGTTFQTAATARNLCIYPAAASGGFDIYVEGIKYNETALQSISFADTDGLKYAYFTADGTNATLSGADVINEDYFQDKPITSVLYWNATLGDVVVFADERHGITMDGATHKYLHESQGTAYVNGMGINGLSNGSGTFTSIDSGHALDEDISLTPDAQATAPFCYRAGAVWTKTAADNLISLIEGGQAVWNENLGTDLSPNYTNTQVTGNDRMIMFVFLTNDGEYPYVKIIGQTLYNDAGDAKDDIETAVNDLILTGLPSPEYLPVGAMLIDDNGDLDEFESGVEYINITALAGGGTLGSSGTTTLHANLTDKNTSGHPATIIDLVAPHWELTATNAEDAINELSAGKQKLSRNITTATTNYSPTVGLDNGGVIELEGGASLEFQIFPNAMSPFPIGSEFTVFQKDAFTGTITFQVGVTINGIAGAGTLTLEQNETYILYQVAIDEWIASKIAVGGGAGDFLADGSVQMTGAIDEFQGANIASATTTDIGAATGNYFSITGTTTITSFGTSNAGVERTIRFLGILTITNGISIVLPTGANIITALGDTCTMRSVGSGIWVCTQYQRVNGTALVGPSDAAIKTAYENNADTNVFTDAEQTKLGTLGNETFELGENLTAGDLVKLLSGGTVENIYTPAGQDVVDTVIGFIGFVPQVQQLSDTQLLTMHENGGEVTCRVLTVTGATVVAGTEYTTVLSASLTEPILGKIDGTTGVVTAQSFNTFSGVGFSVHVYGTVVTFGTYVDTGVSDFFHGQKMVDIGAGRLAYVYKRDGLVNFGIRVVTVTGTTIIFGAENDSTLATSFNINGPDRITDDALVFIYLNGSEAYTQAGTFTGDTYTAGAPQRVSVQFTEDVLNFTIKNYEDGTVVIAYYDGTSGSYIINSLLYTGTVAAIGTSSILYVSADNEMGLGNPTINGIEVVYYHAGFADTYTVQYVVTANNGVLGAESVLYNTQMTRINVFGLSGSTSLIYFDASSDTYNALGTYTYAEVIDYESCIGILQETGLATEEKTVALLGGISEIHSGLTPLVNQYVQSDGTISDTQTAYLLGKAITDTNISLVDSILPEDDLNKTFVLSENLSAGDIVELINDGEIKNILTSAQGTQPASTTLSGDGKAVVIGTDKILIAYLDAGQLPQAVVGTIVNNVITLGTPTEIRATQVFGLAVARSIDDEVLVMYVDAASGTAIYTKVLTISGTTVSLSPAPEAAIAGLPPLPLEGTALVTLSDSTIFATFGLLGVRGMVITIAGATQTHNANATFSFEGAAILNAKLIDTNKVALAFWDAATNINYANIYTISGTTVSGGASVTISAATSDTIDLCKLDTDKILFAYTHNSELFAMVATVTGTTISVNAPVSVSSTYYTDVKLAQFNTDSAVLTYGDASTALKLAPITVSGTVPTVGTEVALAGATSVSIMNEYIAGQITLGVFNYGAGTTELSLYLETPPVGESSLGEALGIIQNTGVTNDRRLVTLLGGVSKVHTGLSVGTKYYLQANGTIGIIQTHKYIGFAISATELDTSEANVFGIGWKDMIGAFNGANAAGTNPPDWIVWLGSVFAYAFSHTVEEELHITYHINHDYKPGTEFFPHIHWSPSTANVGVVRWGFEYTYARGYDQDVFPATATFYVEQEAGGVANTHKIAEDITGVLIPNAETDMIFNVRVFRDATHINDTYPDDAFGFTADVHYQSEHESTENRNYPFN